MFYVELKTGTIHNRQTGYGGVAVMIHPAVAYTVTAKHAEKTCQFLIIWVRENHVTIVYISQAVAIQNEKRPWKT